MSARISQILEVIAQVTERYVPGMSPVQVRELRIAADKEVAKLQSPPIDSTTVSNKYRRELRPEMQSTADFDRALYDHLHSGDTRLQEILSGKANSSEDRAAVSRAFTRSSAFHPRQCGCLAERSG